AGNSTTPGDSTTVAALETYLADGTLPGVTGGLTVALSSLTPAAASIPQNVENVDFTKIDFTNGTNVDVVVNTIRIHRTGLGADGDFTSVTLYDNATKLGNTRTSFNSAHKMVFNISGGWTIPADTTKTLTIKAKVNATGTYNALGIASSDDVVLASGTVSGSFPIYGNQMSAVNIADLGAVKVTGESTTDQTKKIGATGVQLAYFSLEETTGKENLTLNRITLKNIGTAKDTAIDNIYLKHGTTELAGPVSMSNDYITFDLSANPLSIKKSGKEYLKVYGDIMDGDGTTVEFNLRYDTDIEIVGDVYGYNVPVTRDNFDEAGESITTTIDGAELGISLASSAVDTPDEVTNFEFGRFNLSAGQDIKITTMIFAIDETEASGADGVLDIDNPELVDADDGTAYDVTISGSGDASDADETWTVTDEEIIVTAGVTKTLIVRGDIPAGVGDGDQYNVKMTVNTTNLVAETVAGGDAIDNFSVTTLTGKKTTVKSASLTIKATAMNTADAVIGAQDVVLFKGTLEAGAASDVTVERMRFEADAANQCDTNNFTRAEFITGGSTVEQYITSFTDGELDFNELAVNVPAGGSVAFEVQVDLKDSFTANTTVHIQLDTVTAKDSDNDTVSAKKSDGTTTIKDGSE
ncbi:hypothetical protein DRN85_09805, partial [Methanosarcinales archaeon]